MDTFPKGEQENRDARLSQHSKFQGNGRREPQLPQKQTGPLQGLDFQNVVGAKESAAHGGSVVSSVRPKTEMG